jgi:ABC-type transport system involved in multi-copper enzyme maturation permease subunit
MPIYDQSYRPYRGAFSSHATRWWTIARTGVLHFLKRRLFLVFITLTFIPPIVQGFMIYGAHQFPDQTLVKVDAEFFRRMMEIQTAWFLILGIYPGTGLISNDLKWNAIQLYLSKPLTKVDYVLGKFATMAAFLLGVTLVPGLLLFLLELGFSSDSKFLISYWWIPLAVAGYSAAAAISWGLIVLALSSMSKNSRYVGTLLVSFAFFTSGFAQFARGIFNHDGVIVISALDSLKLLSYLFFGGKSEYGDHTLGAALALILMSAAAVLILRARVRAVEVVT